jgi:O-acetyl-ADP-ribose deacetylase (regulator of RNase III)
MSTNHLTHIFPSGLILEVAEGDITAEEVDAIVNAANSQLQHGGGVAGAIARRGGPTIQAESSQWVRQHGPVQHASPAWTSAGNLPCKHVIHAVGPVWGAGDEDAKLIAAVRGSLDTAVRLRCASLALPAISTGIFGFPRARAARVILGALRAWGIEHPETTLRTVRIVLFDGLALGDFLTAAREVLA